MTEISDSDVEVHKYLFEELDALNARIKDKFPDIKDSAYVAQFIPTYHSRNGSAVMSFSTSLYDEARKGTINSQAAYSIAASFVMLTMLNVNHGKRYLQVYGAERFFDTVMPILVLNHSAAADLVMLALDYMKNGSAATKTSGSPQLREAINNAEGLSESLIKLAMATTCDEEFQERKQAVFEKHGFDVEKLPSFLFDKITRDLCMNWLMERSEQHQQSGKLN